MRKSVLAVFVMMLGCSVLLGGCGQQEETTSAAAEMFTDRDFETGYDKSGCVEIQLNGDTAVCSSDKVGISGSVVTVKDEGSYLFTGSLDNGQIIVDAEETDKPQLIFDHVSVNCDDSAALRIIEADKVFVTQTEGSENSISNGGEFVASDDANVDGAVFSKQDLTFNGEGTLTVTSPAGHGIVCKDDMVFTGGTYNISSSSHGVDANDSIRTVNAGFTVTSGKDGFHAENSEDAEKGFVYIGGGNFVIAAEGDGISAGCYGLIENGEFDIVAGGGSENAAEKHSDKWGGFKGGPDGHGPHDTPDEEAAAAESEDEAEESSSMKGIKADGNLTVSGGVFNMDTADDAVHSNSSIVIGGGDFAIAAGDDAVHAETTLDVTAGNVKITESYEGLEALDIVVSGGSVDITSSDDGLNAAGGNDQSGEGGRDSMEAEGETSEGESASGSGSIEINGGIITVHASSDGIDSNGTLLISGGMTVVSGPVDGDTSVLDCDSAAQVTGGTFIGTGSDKWEQSFSDSEQGVISISDLDLTAGTEIILTGSSDAEILTHSLDQPAGIILLSSPDIEKGQIYKLTAGELFCEISAE